MPFTESSVNLALNAIASTIGFVSLHNANPGNTGANEIAGVTRQPTTYNTAANTQSTIVAGVPFSNVPANQTVWWVGLWTAQTGGTFRGYAPAGSTLYGTLSANGTSNVLTCLAHGLVSSDGAKNRVVVWRDKGKALPTGLAEGVIYWVKSETANALELSATQGGATIDIGDGECVFQNIVPATDVLPWNYEVSSFTLLGFS